MNAGKMVCTACSCLCDDIEIEMENGTITGIGNACRKGSAFLFGSQNEKQRAGYLAKGREVEVESALDAAARLLSGARRPLLFGLDNSTLEAQTLGIELARKLGGVLDDSSSFCHGRLVEDILAGMLPTCTHEQIHDADLIIYWGANPHNAQPRHLSRFSLYAHRKYHEAGVKRHVSLAVVDVRESETAGVAHHFFRVLPGEDRDFIAAVIEGIKGKPVGKDAAEFLGLLEKSRCCVIFAGLGLTYSLDNDFSLFYELIGHMGKWLKPAVIPMGGHYNARGFNHSLYNATGYVNKVSFAGGRVAHGDEFSLLEQVRSRAADCLLVVGADLFSALPASLAALLDGVPVITVDPFYTATAGASTGVLGAALSGLEAGGTAVRMDGTVVSLAPVKTPRHLSDEQILKRLLEKLG
ncbi:MAG: formylmethanofuran dehydrogenase subunit B [Peptococcaceae bacterium]|jgi:formylmethanofuran dehydrogenase subunit B|nr:MAG: formylmethanofuran dehydrogenase subunit B [Peptococcaceae bacterium]